LVDAIQIEESVWPKWLRWLRPLLPDDLVSPSVHAIAAVRLLPNGESEIAEVTTFRVRWNASVVEEVTTTADVDGALIETPLADHLKDALLRGNEDTVLDGREGVPVSIYAVSPALGVESDSLRGLAKATGGTVDEVIEALRAARDGASVLLEKFPELSGDLAVVSRAHVVLFLQAMMKRTPAKVLGLMGQVDGNLSEFLRDGMGVETADDRFAPNMNGLKAFLAARQSELKSDLSQKEASLREADGISGKGGPSADRAGYLRALVKGLLQKKGVGERGVSVPEDGLFAAADRRLFGESAVEKWPTNLDVRVYDSPDDYRRAVRGEDRDGYLAVERVRNGYRLHIWKDGTDRDLHAAVMGAARALLFSRNPGMSADLNKALAVRYLEEVGRLRLSVEGASLAAATQWRELETMRGLLNDGRAGRWMTQVFVNLMAGRLGAGKEGAEAAWRQLSALASMPQGDGMALWLASLAQAPSPGLVEPKMAHSLAMIIGEKTFESFIQQALREDPEALKALAAQIEKAPDNFVSLSVAMSTGNERIDGSMMTPERRYARLEKMFLNGAKLGSSHGLALSPAYGALETAQGKPSINLDKVGGILPGADVRIIGPKGTRWTGREDLKLAVDLIVFVGKTVSQVITELKAVIQKVRSAA
jgi:hypothetical protein